MSGFSTPSPPVQIISDLSLEEFDSKIQTGAFLVDSRTAEEFLAGHLEEAVNIPHTETKARIAEFGQDKDREIVLYCKSGGRSSAAQKLLKAEGFVNVFNAGGYTALKR